MVVLCAFVLFILAIFVHFILSMVILLWMINFNVFFGCVCVNLLLHFVLMATMM